MKKSERIYKELVPKMGQEFINHAESYTENYYERIKVKKGMECSIFKHGRLGEIFKYSVSNEYWEDIDEYKKLEFWLEGQHYIILSCIDECQIYINDLGLTVIKGDETVCGNSSIESFIDSFNTFMEQESLTDQAVNY